MTQPVRTGWQPPDEPVGPAPGMEFAGFGARLVAYIIDVLIVSVVLIMLLILGGGLIVGTAGSTQSGLVVVGFLFFVVFILGYYPFFWVRSGATPGMMVMHLRVVRDRDGGTLSVGQAVLRLIGYWVSGAVFYLGYIWIFIDKRRRGWHDLIAGTVVIKIS